MATNTDIAIALEKTHRALDRVEKCLDNSHLSPIVIAHAAKYCGKAQAALDDALAAAGQVVTEDIRGGFTRCEILWSRTCDAVRELGGVA